MSNTRSPRRIASLVIPVGFEASPNSELSPLVDGDVWAHPDTDVTLGDYVAEGDAGWVLTKAGQEHVTPDPLTPAPASPVDGANGEDDTDDGVNDEDEDEDEFDGRDKV